MSDTAPSVSGPAEPLGRQLPVDAILARYRDELAAKTQALFVAQASADAAEAECAQLRLRVIELEQPAEAEAQPAARRR